MKIEKETIAVFDFDGTLIAKDTLLEFVKFSRGNFRFYFGFLIFAPLIVAMKLKLYPNWKTKQKLFSHFYKGVSLKKFNEWGKNFIPIIDELVQPKAKMTLDLHRQNGHRIIVISASMENWIKPWAYKENIETVLATKIETDASGFLTGKFFSKNCYGIEKVNRLMEELPRRHEYQIIAYGNSNGDKELIKFADEGFYKKFK